jgi:hypothetical protein
MSDLVERLRNCGSDRDPFKTYAVCDEAAARIEALEAALFTIYANTEPDAIPHISYDGMTAYQALAKDIADCARAALAPEQDK